MHFITIADHSLSPQHYSIMLLHRMKKRKRLNAGTVENLNADRQIEICLAEGGKHEKNKLGSLSDKSGSPLLCPSLFLGCRWWIQSCQPPVSHRDSRESPEAENVWLTDSKSHCCSASDSDWRRRVSAGPPLPSSPPTASLVIARPLVHHYMNPDLLCVWTTGRLKEDAAGESGFKTWHISFFMFVWLMMTLSRNIMVIIKSLMCDFYPKYSVSLATWICFFSCFVVVVLHPAC